MLTAFDASGGETAARRTARLHYPLLLACIVLPYWNSIPNGFVWDDSAQISTRVPEHVDPIRLLTEPSWLALTGDGTQSAAAIDTYRPLLLLTFLADAALWGEQAWGYHLTNLALFALLGLALLAILRALLSSANVALGCTLVYCTQPLLTESVSWVSGRHDVLMALCLALDVLLLCRACAAAGAARLLFSFGALVAFVLALLSKEPAAMFPVVLAALLWLAPLMQQLSRAQRGALLGAHLVMALGYLLFRSEIIAQGNFVGGTSGAVAVVQAAPQIATKYIGYFAYVPHLTSHYLQARLSGFGLLSFWLPALLHAALLAAAFAYRKRHWPMLVGLVLYYAMLAPSAVMIANKPEYSLRFLFLPSLGLLAVVAVLLGRLYDRATSPMRRTLLSALVLLLVVQAARIHLRNRDYESNFSFYASIVRDVPDSAFGYYGLGLWFQGHGRRQEAERAYRIALRYGPRDGRIYNNLGALLLESRRLPEAKQVLARGIAVSPRNARLRYNLGVVRMALGELRDAEQNLRHAIDLDPGYRKAYRQLYQLYLATDERRASAFRARHARLL